MVKMTVNDIEKLNDEVLNLSRKLNNDLIGDLESSCNNLKKLFQDVSFAYNECEKLHSLNERLKDLQNDTSAVYNEIKIIISETDAKNEQGV